MRTNTNIRLLTGGLLCFAAVVLICIAHVAGAATGTLVAPDGSITCRLGGVQVTQEGNATLTVLDCEAFSCDTDPPPSPPPPPPSVTGDPGAGVWKPNAQTTIFDFSTSSNRTFVPGCLDGQDWRTGCPYNGGMAYGQVFGARVKLSSRSTTIVKVARAETGEDSSSVRGALSAVPGATSATDPRCTFNPLSQQLEIQDTVAAKEFDATWAAFGLANTACVVPSGVQLYFNFTADDQRCGNGVECRVQVISQ